MIFSTNVDSFYAGFLGAFASIVGKLSLSPESPVAVASYRKCLDLKYSFCSHFSIASRLAGLLLMVSSNLLMAFYLLKALEKNESVTVTVISSASNLLFSGLMGFVALGEVIGVSWMVGSVFISSGVLLVLSCQHTQESIKR